MSSRFSATLSITGVNYIMCSIVIVAFLPISASRVGLSSLCIAEGFSEPLQQEGEQQT
jgi:ABC-type long-subunit fatty acid transport system fused permease/ATPase subunit